MLIILFINSFCHGSNQFQLLHRPEIGINTSFSTPLKTSIRNNSANIASLVSLDFSGLYTDAGVSFAKEHIDSLFRVIYKPVSLDWFQLGIGIGNHMYDYFTTFFEDDLLSGVYLSFLYKDIFKFRLHGGHILKITNFKNPEIETRLLNSSWFVGLHADWFINHFADIYIDFRSSDLFEYPFLGTPFFKLGAYFNCNKHIGIGTECTLKIIDMIAVSAAPSDILLTFYTRIML